MTGDNCQDLPWNSFKNMNVKKANYYKRRRCTDQDEENWCAVD